jgi:hypothetical protein
VRWLRRGGRSRERERSCEGSCSCPGCWVKLLRAEKATHTGEEGNPSPGPGPGKSGLCHEGPGPSKPSLSPSFMSKLLKLEWVPHLRDDDPARASLSWHRRTITSVIRRRLPQYCPSRNFRLASSALKSTTESSPSWFSNAQTPIGEGVAHPNQRTGDDSC